MEIDGPLTFLITVFIIVFMGVLLRITWTARKRTFQEMNDTPTSDAAPNEKENSGT